MQRRIDEPPRRPGEYTPRLIPTANPRFGLADVAEGSAGLTATGMPFPISGYQLSQAGGQHHGPVGPSLALAGPQGTGAGPTGGPAPPTPQSLHTQTGPPHSAGLAVNQAMSGGGGQQQQQQQFQRLKVEDALSYLDQVKLQFGNQPQVYNDFLDIMKEFKSQTIDTPGVINRVSNLFKGHPDLIVGFNTFLPPGYKIEVQCETINVHQPGQQVMSIAALAQSQAVSNVNRQKQGVTIWDVALASQASSNQKVGPVHHSGHHSGLPPAASNTSDHRSYHQSPRPPPQPQQQQPDSSSSSSSGIPHSQHQQQHPHHHQHSQQQQQQQQQQQPQQQQQQQQGGQPVEFNHAINYVNKIKNRFQGQPDIYKQFLEILHTYQKEQRHNRDQGTASGPTKPLTESEVYQQVANLFKHQDDLLTEFGQFLPDANGGASSYGGVANFVSTYFAPSQAESSLGVRNDHSSTVKKPSYGTSGSSNKTQTNKSSSGGIKRPAGSASATSSTFPPPAKKKMPKDFSSLSDASKTGSLTEYAFFDKVRKALRHQEVYDNFLRSIVLFNQEIVTKQELVTLVSFFLSKFPDLFREFKDLLGVNEQGGGVEVIPHGAAQKERIGGELAMEIDFNTCKRYGASYRGIPSKFVPPKCSGRTALCREVLNDTWVSFPTWSEDSSFVTSRKTQYEENIYKCEDERFELDYVIETNFSTIKCLEGVLKKMNRMPQDEAAKFKLDNTLGGTSESINRNSIQRIYGDKASDIIEGLKKNPVIAVPLVLRRLKAKDEEWREAQKQFNKLWKEQNEKFYLKSLDHQCANFKQHDIKAIRGKSLLNQIEAIYDERVDQEEAPPQGPMMSFTYEDRNLLEDAGSLIIHHVKRQTGVDKEAKTRIKILVKHLVSDLFYAQRGELSDDDGEANEDMDVDEEEGNGSNGQRNSETSKRAKEKPTSSNNETEERPTRRKGVNGVKKEPKEEAEDDGKAGEASDEKVVKDEDEEGAKGVDDNNERYSLFYCNTTWYIFLRLHQILCSRLLKAHSLTQKLIQEEALTKNDRKESVAKALRLRTPLEAEVQDFYSYFLDMVRAVLDGNLESSQYEDTMREMYGIEAFQFFTMDKLVQNIVRQVQHLVIDDIPTRLARLFEEQKGMGGAGGRWATRHQRTTLEQAYLRQAETILADENPFKFVIRSPVVSMEIDMLDPPPESSTSVKETMAWSSYLTDLASSSGAAGGAAMGPGDVAVGVGVVRKEEFCHRVGSSRAIYLVRNKNRNPQWADFKKQEEEEEEGILKGEDDNDDEDEDLNEEGDGRAKSQSKGGNGSVEVKKEVEDDGSDDKEKSKSGPKVKDGQEGKSSSPAPSTGSQGKPQDVRKEEKSASGDKEEPEDDEDDDDEDMDDDDEEEEGGRRAGKRKRRKTVGDDEGGDSDGGLGDDEDDEEKEETAAEAGGGKRRKIGSSPDGGPRRMHSVDTTSIKFSQNSYHHVFVSKTGFLMFQAGRMARANACHKRMTQFKHSRMSVWTQRWLADKVTTQQRDDCQAWLLGHASDSRANRTAARIVDREDRTPYRPYTRYSLEWVAATTSCATTSTPSVNTSGGRSSPLVTSVPSVNN